MCEQTIGICKISGWESGNKPARYSTIANQTACTRYLLSMNLYGNTLCKSATVHNATTRYMIEL